MWLSAQDAEDIVKSPFCIAGQSHFYGSSIHLKVPTATVAKSKICSMVSPMKFALRSRHKVGLPKSEAQNPVVESNVFPH